MAIEATFIVYGEGKGGGGRTPVEGADSLFSNSMAHILDLVSEGEIEGLVNDAKSIFYNEVPLQAADNSYNFNGVIFRGNNGLEDQPAIPGFDDVRTTVSVAQALPSGVYKTISFPNGGSVTAVEVTVATDNFFEVTKDGDTTGSTVTFDIEKSENGGAFVLVTSGTISGKQKDQYNVDFRVAITNTLGNTAVRVKRTKADSASQKINDLITFKAYTKVTEHKLTYPNSAVFGHTMDAKQFGNQLPSRQYHVRGIKVAIPHNYHQFNRTYTGAFNGTLTSTKYWSNNPAWVFYDLVTSKRYGLGQFFDSTLVDIPSLYTIAKWCDGNMTRPGGTTDDYHPTTGMHGVPDGKGGFEPRWTCNTVINTRGEAFNVLKEMVTCFRGILFWMESKLWAMADQPQSPVKIVNNGNVINGIFTYSGESNRSRHSVVNVSWNDPEIFYRKAIEVHEDPDLIRELGWKPVDFGAFGCTSRAQARRLAKAILYSQEYESELVTYRAGYDHMATDANGPVGVAPGDLIFLADQERGNALAGGRIVSYASLAVTLDRPVTSTGTGSLYVEHPSGAHEYIPCTYVNGSPVVTLTASPAIASPLPYDLFILVAGSAVAETFRVIKIGEVEPNIFEVAAVRYNSGKFAAIYDDTRYPQGDIMRVASGATIDPPTALVVEEGYIYGADKYVRTLELKWTAPVDDLLDYYVVSYSKDNDNWENLSPNGSTSARISDVRAGVYRFRVSSVNRLGQHTSYPLTGSFTVPVAPPGSTLPIGTITNLALQQGGTSFVGKDAALKWTMTNPTQAYLADNSLTINTGLVDAKWRDCLVTIKQTPGNGGATLRTESVVDTVYTYTYEKNFNDTAGVPARTFVVDVQYRDIYGRASAATSATISNPTPVFPANPSVAGVPEGIAVIVSTPADIDYVGVKIYASLAPGFTAGPSNLVYQGTDTSTIIRALGSGTHYIRTLPYDAFGDGTTLTAQQSATPTSVSLVTMYDPVGGFYTIAGNNVTKTGGGGGWANNAYSREVMVGGAYVSAVLTSSGTFIGLGPLNTATNGYLVMPYAVYRGTDGNWYVYESGSVVQSLGSGFTAATVWSITYDNVRVRYYADGILKRTTAASADQALQAAVNIFSVGDSVSNVNLAPYTSNLWADIGGSGKPDNLATANPPGDAINRNSSYELWDSGSPIAHAYSGGVAGSTLTQGSAAKRGVATARFFKYGELYGEYFPVSAGEKLYCSAGYETRTNDTAGTNQGHGRWYLGIQYVNAAGTTLLFDYAVASDNPVSVANGYQDVQGNVSTVPANAVRGRTVVLFEFTDTASNAAGELDYFDVSRSQPGATVGAGWTTNVTNRPPELTDNRIPTAITSLGRLQGSVESGGPAFTSISDLVSGQAGTSISTNSEFRDGTTTGWGLYDNVSGGKTLFTTETDFSAPNASGVVGVITYDGTGTPDVNPTPGYGGVIQQLTDIGSGISRPGFYARHSVIISTIWAKIPVGRSLFAASNSIGDGGGYEWLTTTAGTGEWARYILKTYIGPTGTFSTTGHIYVHSGTNAAFSWRIASYDQVDITNPNRVFMGLSGITDEFGVARYRADLLTSIGTSAFLNGQGYFATQNYADWQSRITGTGKPADNAGTSLVLTALTDSGGVTPTIVGNKISWVGGGSWASGAVTPAGVGDTVYMMGRAVDNGTGMLGLTDAASPSAHWSELDYALYSVTGVGYQVYESGSFVGTVSSTFPVAGHNLAVISDGVKVRYYLNGLLLHTSTASPAGKNLRGMVSLNGVTYSDLQYGPTSSNLWSAIGGAGKAEDNATVGARLGTNLLNGAGTEYVGDPDVLNYRTEDNIVTVYQPGGGTLGGQGANTTGAIKIRLPYTFGATIDAMVRFTVDIYEYATGAMQTYEIGGYVYSTSGTWINCTAKMTGGSAAARTVTFGNDGSYWCVWIGATNTVWQYPAVNVKDLQVSYGALTFSTWRSGWDVSVTTTAFASVSTSVTNPSSGDALFGNNIVKIPGGAPVENAQYQTDLGTALNFFNQAAIATNPDFSNINGTTKPANNATVGATYGSNMYSLPGAISPSNMYGTDYIRADFARYPDDGVFVSARKPAEAGSNVTETRTAAAILNQQPWATLTTPVNSVLRPGQNLLYDGGISLRMSRWTTVGGAYGYDANGHQVNNYTSGGYAHPERVAAQAGIPYTFQAEIATTSGATTSYLSIIFYNASDVFISNHDSTSAAANAGYVLKSVTATAPAGTAYARAVFYAGTLPATNYVVARLLKLEFGSSPTVFSDETTTGALYNDNVNVNALRPQEIGSNVTETRTALNFFNQGALATRGDVLIGSHLKNAAGTEFIGEPDILNNRLENNIVSIATPGGGSFSNQVPDLTGILKIRLPLALDTGEAMIRFNVDIYEYATGAMQTYEIGGYLYDSGVGNDWFNVSARMIGGSGAARTVTFGRDATHWAVWVGSTAGIWQYPSVLVRDVQVSYSQLSVGVWNDGWVVTLNTTAIPYSTTSWANPNPGDALFGTNIVKVAGGTPVANAAYQTDLGTALNLYNQADWATYTGISTGNMAGRVTYLDTSGYLEDIDRITDRRMTHLHRADGVTDVTEAALVTSIGTAAFLNNQGTLATLNNAAWGTNITGRPEAVVNLGDIGGTPRILGDYIMRFGSSETISGFWPQEAAANKTETRTAAFISGQGTLATRGDVLLGTHLKTAAGTTVNDRNALNAYHDGTVVRSAAPGGGAYMPAANVTGALKIRLPYRDVDGWFAMLKFVVDIYEYSTNASQVYEIGGYTYSDLATPDIRWVNTSSRMVGGSGSARAVRFGRDSSGYWCVWLGEPGGTWSYPVVTVRDVQAGHNANNPSFVAVIDNNWVLGVDTATATNVNESNTFPNAGDAVFGYNTLETPNGVVATKAAYRTAEGTALNILNQGLLAIRGDVLIGTHVKDSGGNTVGDPDVLNNRTENTVTTIPDPVGGHASGGSGTAGCIKVRLPNYFNDCMIRFYVDVYEYEYATTTTYLVSGYLNSGAGWTHTDAQYIGRRGAVRPVYFGHDGTKACVFIGEASSSWSYPGVKVRDVEISYSSTAISLWNDGWTVTFSTVGPQNLNTASNVPVPRAGDQVFGEGLLESSAGVVATKAAFKTIEGTALYLNGQAATATSSDFSVVTGSTKPENAADVTMLVNGPTSTTLAYDYQGTIKADQTKNLPFKLLRASGTDITTSASWTRTLKSGNATSTIGASTGMLEVTAVSSDAIIEIAAVYNGATRKASVAVLQATDPPPTGGGGGGSDSTSTIDATTSSSYGAANTRVLSCAAGSGGVVNLSFPADFYRTTDGSLGAYGVWQWRVVGGSFADVTTEIASTVSAYRLNSSGENDPGSIAVTMQKTGLTAATTYEFQLLLRNSTTGTGTWVGTASAVGA